MTSSIPTPNGWPVNPFVFATTISLAEAPNVFLSAKTSAEALPPRAGVNVSCDLNYRAKLWKCGKPAGKVMIDVVAAFNKVNDPDLSETVGWTPGTLCTRSSPGQVPLTGVTGTIKRLSRGGSSRSTPEGSRPAPVADE